MASRTGALQVRAPSLRARLNTHDLIYAAALTFVMLIAALTRLVDLGTLPPGIKYDTASNGLYVLPILHDGLVPFFINQMGAPEPLILYLQSAAVWLFGANVFALRIVTALGSIGAVLVLDALANEMLRDRRAALAAAFALAVSLEEMHDARAGQRFVLIPLFEGLLIWLAWRGWRRGAARISLLAGVVLGLSVYAYPSAVLFPIALVLLGAHQFLLDRPQWNKSWRQGVLIFLAASVVALPRILFHIQYPNAALLRANQVSLFQNPDIGTVGPAGIVMAQLIRYAWMFGIEWTDGAFRQPLLDLPLFVLFLLGLGVVLFRWRRIEYFWAPAMMAVMFLPDLLAAFEPIVSKVRTTGIIPPTFFMIGVGAVFLADAFKREARLRTAATVVVVLLLLLSGASSVNAYFIQKIAATSQSQEYDGFYVSGAEVGEAAWIANQTDPVYVPLNEFARSPVHYLTGARAPLLRSALLADGSLDPAAQVDRAYVLLPVDNARPRTEGKVYTHDPYSYVLVTGDTVLVLPPTREDKPTVEEQLHHANPTEQVRAIDGSVAANAYLIDRASSLFSPPAPVSPPAKPTRFTGGIELVSSVAGSRVQPGDVLPLTLYWRTGQRTSADYVIFVHLLDMNQQVVANADIIPALGAYSTYLWKPGELVPTHHQIKVPARTPPGKYTLEIGLYNILNGERLDVLDERGAAVDSRVIAGAVKVASTQSFAYNPKSKASVDFEQRIALTGYDLPGPGRSGDQLKITAYWRALAEMDQDYTLFVHLLDSQDRIVAQSDHQPQSGGYPTSIWDVGENVRDEFTLDLPQDIADGKYRLEIGWYDFKSGVRLKLGNASQDSWTLPDLIEVHRN